MTAATHAYEGIALRTANDADRIALRGVRLRARVAGMSLRATLEQTFVNLEPNAIEALYTFPLPESAAVCGFEVVFFDKVFTGAVDETDAAIERYDDAIAEGHGAYLLEQHRPDVFSVRVGNLRPRQAVTIRLTYVTDLQPVDRSIRLAFPTTIAPRYATASGTDPIDAAVDADALNPPHVLSVPYGLSMEVEVDLGKNLTTIESPSHAIVARRRHREGEAPSEPSSAHTWNVTFAGAITEMDRDVVLTLHLAREQEPFALAATSAQGERFVALSFLPEFDHDDLAATDVPHAETVFVLDCSGSMQGESIAQAVAALECCLRAMSPGDRFNICRFGSRFYLFEPRSVVYDERTLRRALDFIRNDADLGGTELLEPLNEIFSERPASGAVRNIVLLTDGQVTNEPAVIALAKRHRSRNRLFTFGIGHGCSHFLVAGLARATGGAAEFIARGERIEEKVLRTFGRLASPPVTDVEIDWANADAQVAPRTLPPLFDGDALRAFARVPGKLPETVTLRCNSPTGPKSWPVRVRQATDAADLLPTLWARSMIRSMEEDDGIEASISRQASTAERAKLIDLSKRYNLLCSLTSFVAVEHRSLEDRNEGRPALRRVPLQMIADAEEEIVGLACCISPAPAAGGMGDIALGAAGGSGLLDLTRESDDTTYGAPPPPAAAARGARFRAAQPPTPSRKSIKQKMTSFLKKATPPKASRVDIDKTLDHLKASREKTMDHSLDRSIDKSIDLGGLDESAANDPTQWPMIKLVHAILAEAVRDRASEIHIEPMKDRIQTRFRIDGQFSERDRLPVRLKNPLIARLKIMAGLDIVETRLPQDGRFKLTIDNTEIDFRISTLPSQFGESVVLGILRPGEVAADPAPLPADDALLHLLAHQAADGSFDDSAAVEQVLRQAPLDRAHVLAVIDKLLHDAHVPAALRPRLSHTLLVLLVLRLTFADLQPLWQRAARKAVRYLASAGPLQPARVETWLADLQATPTKPA